MACAFSVFTSFVGGVTVSVTVMELQDGAQGTYK